MRSEAERTARDAVRAFPVVDRFLIGAIVLEIASTPLLPALPIAVFALAFLTPIRRSRWRMIGLGALALILTAMVVVPLVVTHLGIADIVQQGPVRRAH